MASVVAVGRRYLPRGWADLARQIAIWLGFLLAYQVARGVADRHPEEAFANGLKVVSLETNFSDRLYELTLQQFVAQRDWLASLANWTYWTSEFVCLTLALLWLYVRRHEHFAPFRNTLLLANVIGLVGYVAMPTAPPRMLGLGFIDEHHKDGLVQLAANPYAAMPSLHAADALIVGIVLAIVCRRWWAKLFWAVWPLWVWFAVMATGNHFWLDCIAGVAVALVALAIVYRRELFRVGRTVAAQRA
jgi:membrane-associated phospholipid phosphatase